MTPQPKIRPRRSCLAVPGSQTRFHAKADQSAADEIFFDLEDAVAPSGKVAARGQIVQALRTYPYDSKTKVVRVNGCDTEWCHDDIISMVEEAGDRIDCLMIPKVEDVDHVHFVDTLLTQLESKLKLERRIGLELQIESARGLENVGAIAAASSRAETLVFAPGDLSASLQIPELTVGKLMPEYPGDYWHYVLVRILVAARANGLQPIDGPYALIRDIDGLRTFATRAAMLGYDGKWALHPAQIPVLNEIFAPRQEDFDKAAAIVEAYRQATDVQGAGAVMLGDEMIDEASRKMATAMLARGELFGMQARPWRPSEKAG
jgi:citrate lyase subunit beta / citryl-CoA lyase